MTASGGPSPLAGLVGAGRRAWHGWARYWPRPAPGLPPGQRVLAHLPRFSDRPGRWPPLVPADPTLTVRIDGRPIATLRPSDLARFPTGEVTTDLHCVTTWTVRDLRWRGVPLRELVPPELRGGDAPRYAAVRGADGAQARFLLEDLLAPDVIVATHLHGERLTARNGAPMRLVSPSQYGYKSVKHLTDIDVVGEEPPLASGRKEHLRARVALEERHQTVPGLLLRWPYRLVIPVTARWAERSLDGRPRSPTR